jgi:hypothetical protein
MTHNASRYRLGLIGEKNSSLSYRAYGQRFKDCVYGGEDFLKRLLEMAGGEGSEINADSGTANMPLTAFAMKRPLQ